MLLRSPETRMATGIIWIIGGVTSLCFTGMALYSFDLPLPSLELPYPNQLFLLVFLTHFLCLAHLLWRGYGVQLIAIVAAAHALAPAFYALADIYLLACRLAFGILLIATSRKLPAHVGAYGIAPTLVAIITLFIRGDHFAPAIANTFLGIIEFFGSLYLAGVFLWNVRRRKIPPAISACAAEAGGEASP